MPKGAAEPGAKKNDDETQLSFPFRVSERLPPARRWSDARSCDARSHKPLALQELSA